MSACWKEMRIFEEVKNVNVKVGLDGEPMPLSGRVFVETARWRRPCEALAGEENRRLTDDGR